jgi:hypothetical protein
MKGRWVCLLTRVWFGNGRRKRGVVMKMLREIIGLEQKEKDKILHGIMFLCVVAMVVIYCVC